MKIVGVIIVDVKIQEFAVARLARDAGNGDPLAGCVLDLSIADSDVVGILPIMLDGWRADRRFADVPDESLNGWRGRQRQNWSGTINDVIQLDRVIGNGGRIEYESVNDDVGALG